MPHFWKFSRPGEYGTDETSNGYTIVKHPLLGEQKIYIASERFAKKLSNHYKIARKYIASMIECEEFEVAVPEVSMSAERAFSLFHERLKKLEDIKDHDIIIHCRRGRNRSPVACLIYLTDRGIPYNEARDVLEKAMKQRFPNFELNPYGNYTDAIDRLERHSPKRISLTMI